ncbi:large ribosomal subunit protein mL52-like [Liolophura sinensis]|uniref:large ribosomal subunit protein mL52-like n=1 Tax=Liolophura sinensis TaxID=3198878 RepID=UPI0031596B58
MAAVMSAKRGLLLCEVLQRHHRIFRQGFSVTAVPWVGQKWRVSQGMSGDGNRYGPLTDLPDFSYLDGRPAPLAKGQIRREKEKLETAAHVMKLIEEVDFAKARHEKKLKDKERDKTKMIESRLKAKVDEFGKAVTSKPDHK